MSSAPDGWTLAQTQEWLRFAVATPHGLAHGLQRAREHFGAAHPLRPPPRGELGERLAVYVRGYFTRLATCLRLDYPALCAVVGEALFERFVESYLEAHPPRHYSLFQLGAQFPLHLQRTRPPLEAVPEAQRTLLSLPIDLARLERARLETLRAPTVTSARAIPELDLAWLSAQRRIRRSACVRFALLEHDVRAVVRAADEGGAQLHDSLRRCLHADPRARPIRVAVSSVQHRPLFSELSEWQYDALVGCDAGVTLGELSAKIASASAAEPGAALADLILWLPTAAGLGLLEVE